MIVDQRRKSGKSVQGRSSLSNVNEDVDISKVRVNDKPFKVGGVHLVEAQVQTIARCPS